MDTGSEVRMKNSLRERARFRRRFELLGGPYDGQRVWLNTPGTLPIRVPGWYGRYDAEGRWKNL